MKQEKSLLHLQADGKLCCGALPAAWPRSCQPRGRRGGWWLQPGLTQQWCAGRREDASKLHTHRLQGDLLLKRLKRHPRGQKPRTTPASWCSFWSRGKAIRQAGICSPFQCSHLAACALKWSVEELVLFLLRISLSLCWHMVPVHLWHLPGAAGLCEKDRGAWPKGQSCPTPVWVSMDSPCSMWHRFLLWVQPRCSWDVQHFSFKSYVQLLVGPLCNWKVLGKTLGSKRSCDTFQREQWHCYFLL